MLDTSDLHGPCTHEELACHASLERLRAEYIDLYYLQRHESDVPIEESLEALKELISEGKVRYLGLSGASPEEVRRAHAVHPVSAVQLEWSLWRRDCEDELVPLCRELGIGVVAHAPHGRGFLTGKVKTPEDLAEEDWRQASPGFHDESFNKNMALVKAVTVVADLHGVTPGQLALAWVLGQGEDVVPVPGTRRTRYLEENLSSTAIKLTPDQMRKLSRITDPTNVYGERYDEAVMKAPAAAIPEPTKPVEVVESFQNRWTRPSGLKMGDTLPPGVFPYVTETFEDEPLRLQAMSSLNYIREPEVDHQALSSITKLMAQVFQVPFSGVTLINEHQLTVVSPISREEICRDMGGCLAACEWVLVPSRPSVHVVEDMGLDARYRAHASVVRQPHLRFYAGAPLVGSQGFRYGTLCMCDNRPRHFSAELYNTLINFADLVVRELERGRGGASSAGGTRESADSASLGRPDVLAQDAVAFVDASDPDRWVVKYVNEPWIERLGEGGSAALGAGAWLDAVLQDRFEISACGEANLGEALACTHAGREGANMGIVAPGTISLALTPKGDAASRPPTMAATLRPAASDRLLRSNDIGIPNFIQDLATARRDVEELNGGLADGAAVDGELADDIDGDGTVSTPKINNTTDQHSCDEVLSALWFVVIPAAELGSDGLELSRRLSDQRQGSDLGSSGGAIVPDRLGAALAEARVGHALSHPNVVRTLEYAVSAGGEEPVAWIVQEFCGAGTLYDAVDRGWLRDGFDFFSAPDLAALLHTLREVAAGLAHLHAAGVTHGDLTGANVLLVPRGPGFDQEEDGVRESGPGGGGGDLHHPEDSTPTHPTHEGLDTPQQTLAPDPRAFRAKLADFGMSLPLGRGAVLQEVTTYGTVSHMPPELLEAGRLSHAADVYALGVLLYEMHEGQRAWRGLRAPQVLHRVLALGQELRPAPPRPGNPVHAALVALMSPRPRPREAERALAMLAAAPRCAKLGAGDAGARPCVVGALAALAPPADPAVLAGGWVTPRIMPPEAIADFLVRQEAA
ncbi:hypothetical protein QBZ16_001801 [Prototheca wickerhamii]|uniref:Protein kinase domain-containing protein n=1 Tax=Prototheca wickerhamii TaxID=3111 RepID=A0AAD9MK46_PROWI|nr:hypothetical protein QBZ16_001801 [Prototheca wickerhamii]